MQKTGARICCEPEGEMRFTVLIDVILSLMKGRDLIHALPSLLQLTVAFMRTVAELV